MAEITNATTRRRLQLYRNNPIEITTAQAAEGLLIEKKDELYDGEIVIARYGANDGVLGIRTNTDKENGMVLFDSAALSDALQSVSGGTGISVTEKEENNQIISLDIADAEVSGGTIVVKDSNDDEIFTITGVDAANVTYDSTDDNIVTGTTVEEAIKELDAALDAANKANLAVADVTAKDSEATVSLKDSDDNELAAFGVKSTDDNLTVAADGNSAITMDIKSVSGAYDEETGEVTVDGDKGEGVDALAQRSYVDAMVQKAMETGAVTVDSGLSTDTGATTVEMKKVEEVAASEKYAFNMTVGEGEHAQSFNITLDAEDFVKDSVISSANLVYSNAATIATQSNVSAEAELPEGVSTERGEGEEKLKNTFIQLVIKDAVDPEAEETYTRIYVSMTDLLGDLVGGDGITIEGQTVSIDFADQTANNYVQLEIDEDGKLDVTVDQADVVSGTVPGEETTIQAIDGQTQEELRAELEAKGYKNLVWDADTNRFHCTEPDKQGWIVDETATADNNLASAENLADVANDLQGQIDDINAKEIEGSNAIDVSEEGDTTTISLILDDKSTDTIENNQYVGTTNNVLQITDNGLFLSNVWDCGTF